MSIDAQHKLKRTHLEIHFDAMCKQQPTTSRRSQIIFNKLFLGTNTTNTTFRVTSFSFNTFLSSSFSFSTHLLSPMHTTQITLATTLQHLKTLFFAKRTLMGNPHPHLMSWFKTKHFNPKTSKM
jgi:hypothetical protein